MYIQSKTYLLIHYLWMFCLIYFSFAFGRGIFVNLQFILCNHCYTIAISTFHFILLNTFKTLMTIDYSCQPVFNMLVNPNLWLIQRYLWIGLKEFGGSLSLDAKEEIHHHPFWWFMAHKVGQCAFSIQKFWGWLHWTTSSQPVYTSKFLVLDVGVNKWFNDCYMEDYCEENMVHNFINRTM